MFRARNGPSDKTFLPLHKTAKDDEKVEKEKRRKLLGMHHPYCRFGHFGLHESTDYKKKIFGLFLRAFLVMQVT